MIITDKSLEQLSKEKKLEKLTTLYLHYYNIDSFDFSNKNFSKLEFLSIQNNNLTNIDFVKNLPNLWYFDVRNNPLENYESLNIKNVFGFLALSVDKYFEKSFLQIKRLSVGILTVNLDENLKKYFLSNNPNILIYNDELIYEFDKTIKRENMSLGLNPRLLNRKATQELPTQSFNKMRSESFIRKTTTKAEYLMFNSSNTFSDKIITLLKFFNDLNYDAYNTLSLSKLNRGNSSDSNHFFNSTKNVLSGNIIDSNSNTIQPESPNIKNKVLKDENNQFFIRKNTNEVFSELEVKEFLKKERTKLIYISKIYQSILDLNKIPNQIYDEYSKTVLESPINYNGDHSTKQSCMIKKNKKSNYFKLDSLKIKDLKLQIAICTILGLYLIQVINKNMCYVLLKFIFNKFKLTQNDIYCIHSIKSILSLKTEILLGLYYFLIESLKNSNELIIKNNSKTSPLVQISNKTNNIFNEEANQGLVDLSIQKNINKVSEENKTFRENHLIISNNEFKDLNTKSENDEHDLEKRDLKISETNPNFRWEELIKVLELQNLIFNINKISDRANSIYQMVEQNKNEDRKKYLLFNVVKPLDELYNLFDEALILVQYLSDFIKMNNFHDILLSEFTNDYRYFLETKDVFFQYLNNKSQKNLIYDSLTDRIFFKHKQNYLGNSIFFKLKEKRMEEKIAEHQNNLSIKRYLHEVYCENVKETRKFYNSMTDFNKSNLPSNKDIKSKTSFDKINNKQNNLKKFNEMHKIKEDPRQSKMKMHQIFSPKKHFFSQIRKNEQKKENLEKVKKNEDIKNDMAPKGSLIEKNTKPLLGLINREKNNRNEVEKEQTIIIRSVKSRYLETVKLLNNSEMKKNPSECKNLYSRSFDIKSDILQDSMTREKNLNNSKVMFENSLISKENEALNNNSNFYRTNNFLLTQIINNENPIIKPFINENFSENDYRLIPKKEFNKRHNNFFHNELYKVKMIKNINSDDLYKNQNKIDDEVSYYLKTMKLNIGPKHSNCLNNYKRDDEIDIISNNNYKFNSNFLVGEDLNKIPKRFNKTSQDFYPKKINLKSFENSKNFNENNHNNSKSYSKFISRNLVNKDQMSQNNNQEFYLSRPDSPEKFRKSSNNFLIKHIKIMYNEDVINLNNFRMLSPKVTENEDLQDKNMKSINVSNKHKNYLGEYVNMANNKSNSNSQKNNNKFISKFSSAINKKGDNLSNFNNLVIESKPENNHKAYNPKDLFRYSQNNFFDNSNKIILDRKLLKSYNPRRIKIGLDNLAKEERKENNNFEMFGYEKEQETKKKIKITSIFPKKERKEKTIDKNTVLDFRSNYKKLVHRWNEKNPHSNKIKNAAVKQNDFFRVVNKQKKQNLNIMSAKEINQLFSIRNKDEEIFNQIFAELDT